MLKLVSFVALVLCGWVVADVELEPKFDFERDDVGDDGQRVGVRILDLRVTNRLECDVSGDEDDVTVVWKRDGKLVTSLNTEDDPTKFAVEKNDLVIRRTVPVDVDTYTCEVTKDGKTVSKDIHTVSKPLVKIIASPVSIEGEKLKLECQVHGEPTPEIVWRFENDTIEDNEGGRYKLLPNSDKIPNGIMEIASAELSDRGDYVCIVTNEATNHLNLTVEAEVYIRVKDKLAAVWPFIGICAEVIILCSIIFVYERNRTKIELDESDTDGADQKGDQGKDVRQRK